MGGPSRDQRAGGGKAQGILLPGLDTAPVKWTLLPAVMLLPPLDLQDSWAVLTFTIDSPWCCTGPGGFPWSFPKYFL